MWTGHWGPAFILKTLAPEVSLGTLFFAAALPDFLMFTMVLFGSSYETVSLANYLPGTFRYVGDVPFTHSLMGIIIIALVAAYAYFYFTNSKSKLGATAVFLATLSHFPLEIPEHRKDLRIFPTHSPSIGFGLFDSYLITFLLEAAVVSYAYHFYLTRTLAHPNVWKRSQRLAQSLGFLLAIEHILFTLFIVPTENVQFVHAPMFLAQIASTSLLAHVTDRTRTTNSSFWQKAEGLKRELNSAEFTRGGMAAR